MHDFLCLVDLDDESYEHVDGVLSSYSALPGLLIDGKKGKRVSGMAQSKIRVRCKGRKTEIRK